MKVVRLRIPVRVGELAGNIPIICIANGAWNTNDLVEAI